MLPRCRCRLNREHSGTQSRRPTPGVGLVVAASLKRNHLHTGQPRAMRAAPALHRLVVAVSRTATISAPGSPGLQAYSPAGGLISHQSSRYPRQSTTPRPERRDHLDAARTRCAERHSGSVAVDGGDEFLRQFVRVELLPREREVEGVEVREAQRRRDTVEGLFSRQTAPAGDQGPPQAVLSGLQFILEALHRDDRQLARGVDVFDRPEPVVDVELRLRGLRVVEPLLRRAVRLLGGEHQFDRVAVAQALRRAGRSRRSCTRR